MKTNLFNVRHHARVGPGGWFCSCCGPSPKNRKSVSKVHKRKITRILDRLEQDRTT